MLHTSNFLVSDCVFVLNDKGTTAKIINYKKLNYIRLPIELLLPGFTAFVTAKKIESRRTYQVSNNKYLSNGASSGVLPMQGTCTLEADVEFSWNRPPPPDEGCKWRMIRGHNECECWGKHWRYDGERTALQCGAGVGIGGAASPIKAQCWQRDRVDCSDSTCTSLWGPNPHPRSCGPWKCILFGQCVDNACGPLCQDCTASSCVGFCVADGSYHHCWCSRF